MKIIPGLVKVKFKHKIQYSDIDMAGYKIHCADLNDENIMRGCVANNTHKTDMMIDDAAEVYLKLKSHLVYNLQNKLIGWTKNSKKHTGTDDIYLVEPSFKQFLDWYGVKY